MLKFTSAKLLLKMWRIFYRVNNLLTKNTIDTFGMSFTALYEPTLVEYN